MVHHVPKRVGTGDKRLSPASRALIERGARLVLDAPPESLAELDASIMAASGVQAIERVTPTRRAGIRATIRASCRSSTTCLRSTPAT